MKATIFFMVLALTGLTGAAVAASQPTARAAAIVAAGSVVEEVYSGGSNTEGPAVAPDGSVFFVDAVGAGHIMKYDPRTRQTVTYRSPSGFALGMKFDAAGNLVVAEFANSGGRRITRTNLATGKPEIVAALYEGKPFNSPNDLAIDERGRIYFTDYGFAAPHEVLYHRVNAVYRVDPDGTVDRITDHLGLPNGIAVSPDQRTLYVSAARIDITGRQAILAFDLSADGKATFRSIFADLGTAGYADGMAVDVAGNVYVALPRGPRFGVAVFSPAGREVAFIPTPKAATNVAFATEGTQNILYITGGASLYRIATSTVGYRLPARMTK